MKTSPISYSIKFSSAEEARQFDALLAQQAESLGADSPLQKAISEARQKLAKGLQDAQDHQKVLQDQGLVMKGQEQLEKLAKGMVKAARKAGPSEATLSILTEFADDYAKKVDRRPMGWAMGEGDFTLASFQSSPSTWESRLQENIDLQADQVERATAALVKLRATIGAPYPLPSDPKLAQAAQDAWGLVLDRVGQVGAACDIDGYSLWEASRFTTYTRGFYTDDHVTIAHAFRRDRGEQALGPLTESMLEVAETMRDKESLEWQAARVASASKPPRPR